jgi:2-dehydro-3-deoxyphosphogalactonate aldolase
VVVGGVKGLDTMRPYWDVGAAGFGMGSAIFKPGMTTAEVREKADGLVRAITELRG